METPPILRSFPWVDIICFCHEPELSPPTTTINHNHSASSRSLSFGESAIDESPEPQAEPKLPQQPAAAEEEEEASATNKIPLPLWDPFSRHSLESLYFCEHCHTHRCPRCVDTEIVSRYCPQCLFEVTASSARSEGNRCVRNCFRCPDCDTGLTVVGATTAISSDDSPTNSSSSSRSNSRQQEARDGYMLKCPHCQWTSQTSGLTFPKTISLVSHVQASPMRTQGSIDKRFQAMREFYFERSLEEGVTMAASSRQSMADRSKGTADGNNSSSSTGKSSSTFAEILERRIRDKSRKDPGSEIFSDIIEVDEGLDQGNALLQATSSILLEHGSTTTNDIQRDVMDRDQSFPLPQPLRSKRTKRCKACHHILIKPENKPSTTKFKIKLMALYVVKQILQFYDSTILQFYNFTRCLD